MDDKFMSYALTLARKAGEQGEIPVGAVVVKDGRIIGEGYNLREAQSRATAHAEVIAIEEACANIGSWRLSGATLYATMEPCPMCAGAIINSRIDRVVYGCKDSAAGCCGSLINFNSYPFSHAFDVRGGVMENEAAQLLKSFFADKRKIAQ